MTFSAGSIVVLKSGGPAMTVVSSSDNEAECVWIGDIGEFFRHAIPAIALEQVEEEDIEDEDEDEDSDDEESTEKAEEDAA